MLDKQKITIVIYNWMRYPAEQKAETRAKIISSAARLFRERGGEAHGIGTVMKEVGLTKGGFYRHFESRDHLYVEALAQAFREMERGMISAASGAPKGQQLKAMIERYLSMEHLRSPGVGCVISTLGSDIARHPVAVRKQINQSMFRYRENLLPYMPGRTREEKLSVFTLLYASMVGVLMTARTLTDKEAQEQMLTQARASFIQQYCPSTTH